ncbi:MAG: hypothetical protein MZU84_03705 [Sphingobacterium sp.]|nr:hypothetical protein [Sphingobacterium sp.]
MGYTDYVASINLCSVLKNGRRTKEVRVYDYRTNVNLTPVTNSLNDSHLQDFIKCYNADDLNPKEPESERFKKFLL